jgi:hypothetical protein
MSLRYADTYKGMREALEAGVVSQQRKSSMAKTIGLGASSRQGIKGIRGRVKVEGEAAEKKMMESLFERFETASTDSRDSSIEVERLRGIPKTDDVDNTMDADVKEESVGTRLMSDLQEVLGITKAQAAGIVGNFDHETGGFKYLQEIEPVVPGSKGGRGFAMWTGPRRKAFEAWSAENNLNPDSYDASFGFFIHEVQNTNEGRFMEALEKTTTAEEAAKVFSRNYLRPGKPRMSKRISASTNYYNMGM